MTDLAEYSKVINNVLEKDPTVPYRVFADDYKGLMKFKYKLGKILIYGDRSQHWKNMQKVVPVVRPVNND